MAESLQATHDATQLSSREVETRQANLVDQGNFAGAEHVLRTWLDHKQGDTSIDTEIRRVELARVLFYQDKITESEAQARELVQRDGQNTWALSLLGQIEVKKGNYEQAKQLFTAAEALEPQNHEAKTFLRDNTPPEVLVQNQRKTNKTTREIIEENLIQQAIEFKTAEITQQEIHKLQEDFINNGKFTEAELVLKTWRKSHHKESETNLQLELGRVLFWQGKVADARREIERCIDREPNNNWALSFLGQIEARNGRHVRARELFDEALRLNTDNHESQTFLSGDLLDQVDESKQLLTHHKVSPRDRIRFCELSQAIEFKRGKTFNWEDGQFTQQHFDRTNMLLDYAAVGEQVESEFSLRDKLDESKEVVYYSSKAIGDAILGISGVHALAEYFTLHPDKTKPIEIVTPYPEVFAGVAEQYPFVRLKHSSAADYPQDLLQRTEKTFVLSNADPHETFDKLKQTPGDHTLVNMHIDRYSRNIDFWKSPKPPYERYVTYPAKMTRFIEEMVGEKLVENPAEQVAHLQLSQEMRRARTAIEQKYNIIAGEQIHCINESASKIAKKFSPQQIEEVLKGMIAYCDEAEQRTGQQSKIFFIKDKFAAQSFGDVIATWPPEIRSKIQVFEGNLDEIGALASLSNSFVSPDTGIAHMAAALGKRTLILHTVADPYLWEVGGKNIDFLASPQALVAHENLTPVNMIRWEDEEPVMAKTFSSYEILERWKRLLVQSPQASENSQTSALFVS